MNDAARFLADSWDPRISSAREHQTIAAPAANWVNGASGMRITTLMDDATRRVEGLSFYRPQFGATTRTIWMDGRPHPPAYAAHTWQGFSTGTWRGEMLTIETTHLKTGFLRRNGVPASDEATLSEYVFRHESYLTIVRIVDDPIFLEEPMVNSSTWVLDPRQRLAEGPPVQIFEELPGLPHAFTPHFLPGTNTHLKEFADHAGLPFEATRGGKETVYPEYQHTLKALMAAESTPRPGSPSH